MVWSMTGRFHPDHGPWGSYPVIPTAALLPFFRQVAPNLILYASQNPSAQVSYLGPGSSRKEDGMLFLRRQLLRTLSFAFGSNFIWNRSQFGIAAQTAIPPKVSPPLAGTAVRDAIAGGTEMEKVTGI